VSRRPRLSLLLHTHMPYVEGFGTWPFGEEWLWEAMATSYVPLVDVLDRFPGRVTVSVTPVLADQLEHPGAGERFDRFLREVRPASHALDLADERDPAVRAELERSAARYAAAADAFRRLGGDLVAALAPHVGWTSSATHAVLPLLASDAGVRLQVRTGIAAHRARFGEWSGGFWLPECAHAPWLDGLLEEAGVHAVCVDWTDLDRPCVPHRSPAGPLLVPIDREVVELVWSPRGYPSDPAYLDTHRVTERRHRAWAIGGWPYDPAAAGAALRRHAADFVARVKARGGLCVCALDTELLGHWWPEGVDWLAAVLECAQRESLEVLPLEAALADVDAVALEDEVPVTTWGQPRDLTTWSAPSAGGLVWRQRAAELEVLAAARASGAVGERALRELLALQSSDWAFLVSRATAGPYPAERAAAHEAALRRALAGGEADASVRGLAPWLDAAALLEP
jgi:1,4-alpha-glucan branching enzyme